MTPPATTPSSVTAPTAFDRIAARVPRVLYELAFGLVTLGSAAPLYATRHLPLQDLPQHMAAISVLRRLPFDPTLATYFTATLSRTQYLLVYVLGVVLSVPLGVEGATRLIAAVTVCSLPYALRFVLRRTGGDPRLAALVWPLAWNPQMMLGFLNFLLGVPVALLAVGLFAEQSSRRRITRQVALAALALAAFYSHLVPFGMLGLGVFLLLPFDHTAALRGTLPTATQRLRAFTLDLRDATRDVLFLLPSLLAAVVWLARTPATDASVRAGGVGVAPHPEWPVLSSLPRELSTTLLDFPGDRDERALLVWGLCALAAIALARRTQTLRPSFHPSSGAPTAMRAGVALGVPLAAVLAFLLHHGSHVRLSGLWSTEYAVETSWGQMAWHCALVWAVASFVGLALAGVPSLGDEPDDTGYPDARGLRARAGARLAWLPVACAVLYVCTPSSYGWIWPIHTRFAVAAALTLPLLVSSIRPVTGSMALCAALAVASLGLSADVADRFARWDTTELGDLDAALDHARPNRRLVALVPAVSSPLVPNVPLLHAAAYYQVRGGAVATFSFADFPQSPFRYRDDGPRPPRLPPRWEWTTDLRVADPTATYYDYVLARVGMFDGTLRAAGVFDPVYEGREWTLWARHGR